MDYTTVHTCKKIISTIGVVLCSSLSHVAQLQIIDHQQGLLQQQPELGETATRTFLLLPAGGGSGTTKSPRRYWMLGEIRVLCVHYTRMHF